MKTAVEELIEDLQDMCPDYYNSNFNWLHNLLEKEKQQIIDAYEKGTDEGINDGGEDSEKYYNETFKNKL